MCNTHYWLSIASDMKGIPTEYKCINCNVKYKIPSRDKKAREYLRQKYSKK